MTRAKGRRVMTTPEDKANEETRSVDFYNQHDGLRGRDPNAMYLDVQERVHAAETAAALGFDVDPSNNYVNYITTGTPLVPKSLLGDNLTSNPAQVHRDSRGDVREIDPIVTADVPVTADGVGFDASPFGGSGTEDGSSVPVDDGSATTEGTGASVPFHDVTGVDPANDPHSDLNS